MTALTWSESADRRKEIIDHISGRNPVRAHPPAITAPGEGGKFTPAGEVLNFPGNTFICHIGRNSRFFDALCDMQDELKAMYYADHFSFLPKPSFHMTVFCGISGSPLGSDGLPEGFQPGTSLGEVSAGYLARLESETGRAGFVVRPTGLRLPATIEMEPLNPEESDKLRGMRTKLQALTGLYREDFPTYRFHVSMAYLIKWLMPDEAEIVMCEAERLFAKYCLALEEPVVLGPVEFCEFDTMHHFAKLGLLSPEGFVPASR
ncbi:DUF1868 domain-containing protein [uncultured Roseibium sp.]|uniref:DUF1868 domain-containing protein n=1 Tax=uncultured Roseibium sp. TaxID=1936171 RepID=UPI00321692C0